MRATLATLGDALAEQLSDDGLAPHVRRNWEARDERTWQVRDGVFEVRPARLWTREALDGYEGAADASLVRETVRLVIEQREENIRAVYRKILADATGQAAGRPLGVSSPNDHISGDPAVAGGLIPQGS